MESTRGKGFFIYINSEHPMRPLLIALRNQRQRSLKVGMVMHNRSSTEDIDEMSLVGALMVINGLGFVPGLDGKGGSTSDTSITHSHRYHLYDMKWYARDGYAWK